MPYKDPVVAKAYAREYALKNRERLYSYRIAYRADNQDKEWLWQEAYREKTVEKRKAYSREYRYGVTPELYVGMLVKQKSSCMICGNIFTKTPHIDHCHTTGKVRALLCSPCNTGLGVYEKKHELFKQYLEQYD